MFSFTSRSCAQCCIKLYLKLKSPVNMTRLADDRALYNEYVFVCDLTI